jgi:hypothetical protein
MSSQSFIGIEVNDSEVEKIKNNRVSINSDTGKGIQVNRSKVGEIVGNQIISSEQLELLRNLKSDTENLISQNTDQEIKSSLNEILSQIDNVNNADQESLLNKVHTLSETISYIIEVFAENSPVTMILAPYLFKLWQLFCR